MQEEFVRPVQPAITNRPSLPQTLINSLIRTMVVHINSFLSHRTCLESRAYIIRRLIGGRLSESKGVGNGKREHKDFELWSEGF
jgi:hypothetical protein